MKNWFSTHSKKLQWIGILMVAILYGWTLVLGDKSRKEHEARQTQYLVDHKCVTVSYAGKDAEPVYQCDNGLVMRKQIP